MNKLIYKKILSEYLIFFAITLSSATVIVWIFQAVNFLDIMLEDGKGYITYFNYSLLSLPKIISRLLPFVTFFSFFYIIIKNEKNNELLIFWNFGINKIGLVYFFFYISVILMIFQILLTSLIVPNSLKYSRDLMKNSNINLFEGFIKPKKFNDTIKNLTIYSEGVTEKGNLFRIYIKKNTGDNSFQITYAKEGKLKIGNNNFLELYDGETINNIDNKISKFKFQRSDFSLNALNSKIVDPNKLQETPTLILLSCLNKLYKKEISFLDSIDIKMYDHNCTMVGVNNIFKELYKRFIIPFYIPNLILTTLILILFSKEEKGYTQLQIFVFLINFFLIIFSEATLKILGNSITYDYMLLILPIIILLILLINFIYQFKLKFNRT
jgi:lipopolysaccharide export system permease protein